MAIWTVRTLFHKQCLVYEYWTHPQHGTIKCTVGWRTAEFDVETSDDQTPQFVFRKLPGGDDAVDSIDMYDCDYNNIDNAELVELWDGWYDDVEFPQSMKPKEQKRLLKLADEEGWNILEDEDWYLNETETWVWGPLEITNASGEVVRTVCADASGNLIDYVDPNPPARVVTAEDILAAAK